uniref:Uncharacterized protein n=1 Tax=Anguilla anguilla TaxID=7936 RepID=A0A0E9XWB5_ANGAN
MTLMNHLCREHPKKPADTAALQDWSLTPVR